MHLLCFTGDSNAGVTIPLTLRGMLGTPETSMVDGGGFKTLCAGTCIYLQQLIKKGKWFRASDTKSKVVHRLQFLLSSE